MTLRTAKSSLTASTFAALVEHQIEMQGAFATIEVGDHGVDLSDVDFDADRDRDELIAEVAALVGDEIADAIEALSDEADDNGDASLVSFCGIALAGDVEGLEACCAAICDAAAMGD